MITEKIASGSRAKDISKAGISVPLTYVEVNEWSDINVSNVREAHIEIIFCSDS